MKLLDLDEKPRISIKRASKRSFAYDKDTLFKDVNLKDIFGQEELEMLLKEPLFSLNNKITENDLPNSRENSFEIIKKTGSLNLLFDRTNLILKFLKLAIEKLNHYHESTLAKGLDW
jgi:hypothetical protein